VNAPAPSSSEPEVVSKSEFARLSNVVPGRVTQWISAKQIYGDALVGEGRAARIRVAVARAQLKRHLDVGQRLGNGLSTRLDSPSAQPSLPGATNASAAPAEAQVPPFVRAADAIEEQIKTERLVSYQRDNRRKAEEEAARSGRYALADDAKQQMGRIASQMLNTFDGWLGEVASTVSGKFSLPQRDVLYLMRSEFRTFRSRASAALRQQVQEIAKLAEDNLPEDESAGEDAEV
jgi:hypothetical protein